MSTKRSIDCLSMSLDEIINVKKIEPPRKRKRHCKLSKWERYNRRDSDSEEEEDYGISGGRGQQTYSSDESDDEPVNIPLHRDSDDEDRFTSLKGNGPSYPRNNYGTSNGYRSGSTIVNNNGASEVLGGHSFLDDEVAPVEEYGSITFHRADADIMAVNSGTNMNQLRDLGGPGARMNLQPQWKPLGYQNGQMEKTVELITLSDDENERRYTSPFQNNRNAGLPMHNTSAEMDAAHVSLADVIQKAKECFSSNNNNNNNGSYSTPFPSMSLSTLEGCPASLLQQNLGKYWRMRYHLFSKYDQGIKLDEESWYSVTPEVIAAKIAQRCQTLNGVVVDGFCGCGGNAIQFAKVMKRVIAIDIDPVKIEYAKNNARIYGVDHKISFKVGDFMKIAPSLKADMVFLSPPWGGPAYNRVKTFDLRTMIPMDGFKIFEIAKSISPNIAYFVPRNTDKGQLMQLAGPGRHVEIQENMLDGRILTITAYYGGFVSGMEDEEDY